MREEDAPLAIDVQKPERTRHAHERALLPRERDGAKRLPLPWLGHREPDLVARRRPGETLRDEVGHQRSLVPGEVDHVHRRPLRVSRPTARPSPRMMKERQPVASR